MPLLFHWGFPLHQWRCRSSKCAAAYSHVWALLHRRIGQCDWTTGNHRAVESARCRSQDGRNLFNRHSPRAGQQQIDGNNALRYEVGIHTAGWETDWEHSLQSNLTKSFGLYICKFSVLVIHWLYKNTMNEVYYDNSHLVVSLTARTFKCWYMLLCATKSCFHSFLLFCAVSTSKSYCYRFAIQVR